MSATVQTTRSGSGAGAFGSLTALHLFDRAIAEDDHVIARQLRRRSQRGRRFAWVTPWATRMGWEGGDYGDRLIEVTLADNAWTAFYDPRSERRWRVVDSEGAAVHERLVANHPDRIGAVYHVGRGPRAFREIVLVNEALVERWAYATDAIRGRASADAQQLRRLADHLDAAPVEQASFGQVEFGQWLEQGWPDVSGATLSDRYRSCLSLGSEAYVPTPAHLRAIAAAIDPLPQDTALEGTGAQPAPRRRRVRRHRRQQPFCDPTMGCP